MAALRGVMDYGHHAETVSRLAHENLSARLSTWKTHVYAHIDKYGRVHGNIERDGKTVKEFRFDIPENKEEMVKDIARRERKRDREREQ